MDRIRIVDKDRIWKNVKSYEVCLFWKLLKYLEKFIQTSTEFGRILHGICVEKFLTVHIFPQAGIICYFWHEIYGGLHDGRNRYKPGKE